VFSKLALNPYRKISSDFNLLYNAVATSCILQIATAKIKEDFFEYSAIRC